MVARAVRYGPSIPVVRADSKLTNLSDVLAALRSKPGSLTFGHNGAGTNGHLAIRMLAGAAKVEPNEISYRGTSAQRTDLMGGHRGGRDDQPQRSSGIARYQQGRTSRHCDIVKVALAVAARRADGRGAGVPGHDDGGAWLCSAERRCRRRRQEAQATIAESLRDPEYIKSSSGDVPVLAFMPGAEWQKRLDDMSQGLRPFAEEMRVSEQK